MRFGLPRAGNLNFTAISASMRMATAQALRGAAQLYTKSVVLRPITPQESRNPSVKFAIVLRQASAAMLAAALFSPAVRADEGMWTFDNPPVKQLQEKFNFTPTQQWLDHLRLSSVRLNDGG